MQQARSISETIKKIIEFFSDSISLFLNISTKLGLKRFSFQMVRLFSVVGSVIYLAINHAKKHCTLIGAKAYRRLEGIR